MQDLNNLNDLLNELKYLEDRKKQADQKMAEQRGKTYEFGFWWGTYCALDHRIDKIQFEISEMKKSAVAERP